MRSRILKKIILMLFSINISVLAHGQAGSNESLALKPPLSIINIGDDVSVSAILTNVSQHTIDEARKGDGTISCLDLTIKNEQGTALRERPPDQSVCQGRSGCEVLRMPLGRDISLLLSPKQSVTNTFKISELYNLDTPGRYYLQVTCGKLKSNSITLTVQGKRN